MSFLRWLSTVRATTLLKLYLHSSWFKSLIVLILFTSTYGGESWGKRPSWTLAKRPSRGAAKSIGGYASGCLQGAQRLPKKGAGYQSIRRSRNRFYGHPNTVKLVQELGRAIAKTGLAPVEVGDLSQPRGGRMRYGHRSHQSGLDIDIWFGGPKSYHKSEGVKRLKRAKRIKDKKKRRRAIFEAKHPSVVHGPKEELDQAVWSSRHVKLLKLAAQRSEVARIFVHFRIKEQMCAEYQASPESQHSPAPLWLRKLRPWYGHDQHFHIRLHCPEDSPECEAQGPLPSGPGCEGLSWFSRKERRQRKREAKRREEEELKRVAKLSSQARAQYELTTKQREEKAQAEKRARLDKLSRRCAHLKPQ